MADENPPPAPEASLSGGAPAPSPDALSPGVPPAAVAVEPPASVPGTEASGAAPAALTMAVGDPPIHPAPVEIRPTPAAPAPLAPFTFHGDAREYFRIWIVNTLLTLLTCGVFAAWAKVRKRRYFRGNTEVLGHRFDYHAEPWRLLVGNILVAFLFVAYVVVGEVYPLVRVGAFLAGAVLLPWIVVRSLAFNAHNTSYRGIRFYFGQPYGSAALLYLGQAVVIAITLGFYYPAWQRNRRQFIVSNHRLGDAFFRFESGSSPFYLAYLVGGLMVAGAAIVGLLVTVGIVMAQKGRIPGLTQMLPYLAIYGTAFFLARHYVYARLFNQVWNRTHLDRHRFVASLRTGAWMRLQLTNLLAMIGSCGLLYPWAAVRSMRHLAGSLHFQPAGPVETIGRLGRNTGSAVGDTTAEFMGMDFGL